MSFSDYQPVARSISSTQARVTLTIATIADNILEGTEEITLTFTSAIPNFVRRVEDRGDFASHTAVVKIIDSESKLWSKESTLYCQNERGYIWGWQK